MCCSNPGYFSNPMNNGCCMSNYNCYYTPNCGCNNGCNNGGFFNNGFGGFGGGGWGSSLELIALFSLLCR